MRGAISRLAPYLIPGIVALGFVLRLIGVDPRPLDGDEGVILLAANGSLTDLLIRASADVHPPLFHLLTSGVFAVGGVSAFTLRLVSVVAGTALVALAPALARRLHANEALVTALVATSPFLVNLSQDARMYSLFGFLALASWLTLADLWGESAEWRRWVLWGLLGLGLVLTHHLGWLVLGAEVVATVVWHRKTVRLASVQFLFVGLLLIVGYLPQLPTTLAQVTGRLAEQSYAVGFGERLESLVGALYRMLAGRTFLGLGPETLLPLLQEHRLAFLGFIVTLVIPAILLLLGMIHLGVTKRTILRDWLTLGGVSLIVAVAVGTVAVHAPRYLSFLAPFLLALVALGLQELWVSRKLWGTLVALALAGTIGAGLFAQLITHNRAPGLDAYVTAVMRDRRPDDTLLIRGAFAAGETTAFRYEARRQGLSTEDINDHSIEPTDALFVDDLFYDYTVGNLGELRAVSPAERLNDRLQYYSRVWFFDQTYAPDPLAGLDPSFSVEVQELGYDKERMPLRLYLVTKNSGG